MKGTVVVQAAGAGGGDTGSGSAEGSGSGTAGSGADLGSTAGGTASGSDSGSSLPATGMDAAALAVLGLLMLALGTAVRRRSRDEQPRPAGRVGW